MKKKKYITRPSADRRHFFFVLGAFALGCITTFVAGQVFAQVSSPEKINACVNSVNGNVRILKTGESCKNGEYALDWNKQGPQGEPGSSGQSSGGLSSPFFCTSCYLAGVADKFAGKDFSRSQILKSDFTGGNLTGVNFKDSFLSGNKFNTTNLTNADLSNNKEITGWGTPQNNNYTGANLTNANLSGSLHHESNFTNANLQGANFSNSTLRSTKFTGSQNASTANFTGATWENVTCPDGTNSNTNGGTCVGHL